MVARLSRKQEDSVRIRVKPKRSCTPLTIPWQEFADANSVALRGFYFCCRPLDEEGVGASGRRFWIC